MKEFFGLFGFLVDFQCISVIYLFLGFDPANLLAYVDNCCCIRCPHILTIKDSRCYRLDDLRLDTNKHLTNSSHFYISFFLPLFRIFFFFYYHDYFYYFLVLFIFFLAVVQFDYIPNSWLLTTSVRKLSVKLTNAYNCQGTEPLFVVCSILRTLIVVFDR